MLASEPSDYSYFKTDLMRTWAGPEHWKLQPKPKGKLLKLLFVLSVFSHLNSAIVVVHGVPRFCYVVTVCV